MEIVISVIFEEKKFKLREVEVQRGDAIDLEYFWNFLVHKKFSLENKIVGRVCNCLHIQFAGSLCDYTLRLHESIKFYYTNKKCSYVVYKNVFEVDSAKPRMYWNSRASSKF